MLRHLFVSCALIFAVRGAKLPSYIKPCRRSDPNLNQCALSRSTEAIVQILNGDKNFHLPNLKPFHLPEITIDASENLKLKINDVVLSGLENVVVKTINIDIKKRRIEVTCYDDNINLVGNCDINGRILILPITGKGPCNITFVGGTYHYSFDYDLMNKKGKEYAVVKNNKVTFEANRVYYHFDNLFGGDKRLGEETNNFLNENWKEVNKDLSPAISGTVNSIITAIINGYFTRIPYDDVFLP